MQPLRGGLAPLTLPTGTAVIPWYLSGGVSAANCIAAYKPKGAASLAASYTNLANPGTYNAAPGVAPTWNSTDGWIFATPQRLLTGIVWTNNQTWSIIVRFSDVNDYNSALLGSTSNSGFLLIQANTPDGVYYWNGTALIKVGNLTNGVLAVAGNKGYRNGTAETGTIPAAGTANTAQLVFGSYVTSNGLLNGKIQAAAVYNATLTPTQVAAITLSMQNL